MTLVPASSHGGGGSFNGGTITEPLNVEPTTTGEQAFGVKDGEGVSRFQIGGEGAFDVVAAGGDIRLDAGSVFNFLDSSFAPTVQVAESGLFFVGAPVVLLTGIPTVDPHNSGQLWNDAGTLKISAG